jgi:hypothetical protein
LGSISVLGRSSNQANVAAELVARNAPAVGSGGARSARVSTVRAARHMVVSNNGSH